MPIQWLIQGADLVEYYAIKTTIAVSLLGQSQCKPNLCVHVNLRLGVVVFKIFKMFIKLQQKKKSSSLVMTLHKRFCLERCECNCMEKSGIHGEKIVRFDNCQDLNSIKQSSAFMFTLIGKFFLRNLLLIWTETNELKWIKIESNKVDS